MKKSEKSLEPLRNRFIDWFVDKVQTWLSKIEEKKAIDLNQKR